MGSENRAAILAAMPDAAKEAVAGTLPTDTADALGLVVASGPVAVAEKPHPKYSMELRSSSLVTT